MQRLLRTHSPYWQLQADRPDIFNRQTFIWLMNWIALNTRTGGGPRSPSLRLHVVHQYWHFPPTAAAATNPHALVVRMFSSLWLWLKREFRNLHLISGEIRVPRIERSFCISLATERVAPDDRVQTQSNFPATIIHSSHSEFSSLSSSIPLAFRREFEFACCPRKFDSWMRIKLQHEEEIHDEINTSKIQLSFDKTRG